MGRDLGDCHLHIAGDLTVLELMDELVMNPMLLLLHLHFRGTRPCLEGRLGWRTALPGPVM